MNIVCTINNNYIRHCAVMLPSLRLRDSNPAEELRVYTSFAKSLTPKRGGNS
jgi:lipopolysaccharide biosynthesis glycosyltransferase